MAFNCGQSLLSKCCGRSCIAKWACFCDISVSNSNNQNSGNLVSIYNCTGKSLDDSYNVVEIEGGNQTFHSWNSSFCYTKDTCAFYVENTLSSTIKWATFSSNKANRGSVLNSWNSSLSYSYSNIYNNTETFRGLFLLPQTTLTLNNCIFINNNVKQLFSNQAIDGASHPYQLNVFNCIWPSNLNTGLNFQSSSNNLQTNTVTYILTHFDNNLCQVEVSNPPILVPTPAQTMPGPCFRPSDKNLKPLYKIGQISLLFIYFQ